MPLRIFLEKEEIPKDRSLNLTGERARYITRVLRLVPGDFLTLCAGDDVEYACNILAVEGKAVKLRVLGTAKIDLESNLDITLCQSLPKARKMELIIQKGTELGVKRFIPFLSSRSIARPGRDAIGDKRERWQKIAVEAARQSGRSFRPIVEGLKDFDELISGFNEAGLKNSLKLMPWESEEVTGLKSLSQAAPERVIVLIGPEGGFSAGEAEAAKKEGFVPVSLGKRILRTETAGLAAVSILQFLWGDMG